MREHFYVLGVDPGVTRTGVIIMRDDEEVMAGATFHSAGPPYSGMEQGARVHDLSLQIGEWVLSKPWAISRMAMETPVMGKPPNVKAFQLQWRLYQALQGVLHATSYIEVHNATAKKAATGSGNANKNQMVSASPFEWDMFGDTVTARASVEALADAWGIALVALHPSPAGAWASSRGTLAAHLGPVHELE